MTRAAPALRDLGLLLLLGGCYSYVPLQAAAPAPGLRVAARLTDAGTARLGRLLGENVGVVEGDVVVATDSALALSVRVVRQRNGVDAFWNGEVVTLPRADIGELRQRTLSRTRSWLTAGGVTVAALVLGNEFSGGGVFGTSIGSGRRGGGH